MKKTILLSTVILLSGLVPVFSDSIFSPDADRLRKIIDVKDYEGYYYLRGEYDDVVKKIHYIDIYPEPYSHEPDLLEKAIFEKNEEAVEIILPYLDSEYDFFEERYDDDITYNIISLARESGSERIKTMIYDAALPEIVDEYSFHYRLFKEQFDKNKNFLTYVLSKNTRGFKIGDNYGDNYYDLVICAVKEGNIPILEFLLENGLNPSEVNMFSYLAQNNGFYEETPYEAKKEVIDLLLAHGANIDFLPLCDEYDRYDFFSYMTDIDFQILMLERGMPIDLVKQDCLYYLLDHYSDFKVDEKGSYLVSLLINAGANVNYIDKSTGESVLYKACWKDNNEANIVKLLLENGATTKVTLRQRIKMKYPVEKALWVGNYEALKAMKEHGLKLKGRRTLYAAASSPSDSVECLKLVLEDNKKFDRRDFFGETAFWQAAWRCNPKIMNYLKELGANINVQNWFTGQTGLMAFFDYIYFLETETDNMLYSLTMGMDLTLKDRKGKTLRDYILFAAARADNEEEKERSNLVVAEIDRKLAGIGYSTEITVNEAILTDNNEALSKLLMDPNEKAKINVADKKGLYSIDYAIKRKNYEAVGILCKNGSVFTKQMLKDAIRQNNFEMIDAFFSNGVNINISLENDDYINDAEYFSETPLDWAISYMPDRDIPKILKYKPDLNHPYGKSVENPKGYNCLYYLVTKHSFSGDLLLQLIEAGADPFYNGYEFFEEYLDSDNGSKYEVMEKLLEKEGFTERFYDENGYFLGKQNRYGYYDWMTQEKILKEKIMTATDNLNIRSLYLPDRGYEEGYDGEYYQEDVPEIICTIKAGSKVIVREVLNKEEIDGMNKFWVEVEITEDAQTVDGKPIEPGTIGRCYSGYLEF